MSDSHLFLFACITPKAEYAIEAKQALVGILAATRAESGCLQFELHDNFATHDNLKANGEFESHGNETGQLFLYEEWVNEAALEQHYQQPYTQAVFESYQEWLAKPVEINKMYKVVLS